jgi:two-component system chemotaxis response regulator CheB
MSDSLRPTRVMIVDDSIVVRGFASRWLQQEGFVIVGAVANGRIALEIMAQARPDIVLLDIDMPELDGLATLPRLLALDPGLAVVVISTLTRRNAELSLECLARGALDCLSKPTAEDEVANPRGFRRELISKLTALAEGRGLRRTSEAPTSAPVPPVGTGATRPAALSALAPPRCLLVGASTGGPQAVTEVLRHLGRAAARCRFWWSNTCRRYSPPPSRIGSQPRPGCRPTRRATATGSRLDTSMSPRAAAIWGSRARVSRSASATGH